jgi:hypothetical protein
MKNNFYRNVSNFLVISLPINLLIFLILMGLEWLLRRYRIFKPIQVILKPFRSFVCFFSAMFAENMTYLSFHCFLQLYRFVPYAHGQHTFPSSILCLIMLFTTLITAIFLSFAAWIYASKTFQIDYCKTSNSKSYLFFGFALTGKFAAGFAHAYVDNPKHIVLGLLIINCFVFGVLIYCWKAMQFKTYLSVYFVVYLGKVVMHLQLLL